MFIEFPDHDKLINVDSIDRIEIQTNHNGDNAWQRPQLFGHEIADVKKVF